MTLKEHIDNIRNGLERQQFTSETAVRQGIINPLLEELGWPTSKTQIVFPEYTVERGKVDYALCHPPEMPRIFIEAKQPGKLDGAERQLFGYAVHQGVRVAILTDGQRWAFFYPSGEGTYEERKVVELNFLTGDSEKSAILLSKYLNYESVRTGDAFDAIEEDYRIFSRQRELARHLPEVWHKILDEKNQMLLQTMIEDTKKVCRYIPTEKEVLAFLKSLAADRKEDLVPPIQVPSVPSVSKPKRSPRWTRLVITMPDGERIERPLIKDTYVEVIEKLGVEKVAALDISRQKTPLIAVSEYPDRYQRPSGSYYILTDTTTIEKRRDLLKIAKGLNLEDKLKVEIIPKE